MRANRATDLPDANSLAHLREAFAGAPELVIHQRQF
jgi:hypothetical protein